MKMKMKNGFTLVELMITVAIIGILMSIALPNYSTYILRSQITEATSNLSSMQVKMEQYFQDNRTYVGACTNGTIAALPSNLKYFTLTCSNLAVDTYTITATGTNGFTFTVDESNNRKTTAVPSGWTSSNSCWITNKGGVCS